MAEALHVTLTGIVGDYLWGVDTRSGEAVVWDQKRVAFRVPTHEESMGARRHKLVGCETCRHAPCMCTYSNLPASDNGERG